MRDRQEVSERWTNNKKCVRDERGGNEERTDEEREVYETESK